MFFPLPVVDVAMTIFVSQGAGDPSPSYFANGPKKVVLCPRENYTPQRHCAAQRVKDGNLKGSTTTSRTLQKCGKVRHLRETREHWADYCSQDSDQTLKCHPGL